MSDRGVERRKFPRVDVVLKVEYQTPSDLLDDYITDLSEGGIFIRTALPFQTGDRLEFSLSFPGLLEPLHLSGVVRWRRANTDNAEAHPTGLGVEIVFPNESARQQVRQLVLMLREQQVIPTFSHDYPFRVLLLEDNERVQEMFRYAVKQFHFENIADVPLDVFTASNGNEAWELLQREPIHLAILDHFVPGITGCEVARHMRADGRLFATPVLVVSAGGDDIKREALIAGADLFVDKPVMLRQLVESIRALVLKHAVNSQR